MDNDQFLRLLEVFEKISNKSFSIADATDWPILVTTGGIIIALVAFMWRDLRFTVIEALKDYKTESNAKIDKLREENDKEHEALRAEIKEIRECK